MKSYLIVKKILDFIFASLLLIVSSPIMLLCALLIKLEDPDGPVIYKQDRIGKDLKVFKVFKFRSMKVEMERDGVRLKDEERMLKIGDILRKLSLDELPQLLNIIKGQMSFIGPRPMPILYLPYFTDDELHRHDIRPGISGWAQVNGRNYLSWDERFEYDLEYVYNISFSLDLRIFILTVKKVFLRSDVGVRGVDFADVSLHEIREKNKKFT